MKNKILEAFLYKNKLRFSEIKEKVNLRSNHLAYHLKKMVSEGTIEKDGESYKISKESEQMIPYITNKKSVLPVILIQIKDGNKVFLYKREKRPHNGKLGLPGGRLLLGETIPDATKRILKDKFKINASFKKVNSVSLEHVKKDDKIFHSFLLIFVTAETSQKLGYVSPKENRSKIIPSDYKLILNDSEKEIKIPKIITNSN